MFREVADNRDGDGVSHGAVCVVVVRGELVGIRCSHEARGFTSGNEASAPLSLFMEDEELTTTSALRCSEASGDIVEAKFQNLLSVPGAAVAWEHCTLTLGNAF